MLCIVIIFQFKQSIQKMYMQESMLQTMKQLPKVISSSNNKHQRRKQLHQLADSTKQQIHQTIIQYKHLLDHKQQQFIQDINDNLLNALEKIDGIQIQFEEDNINQKIDDRLIFSPILNQLSSLFNANHSSRADNSIIDRLQSKLQEAIINEQRLKQKLEEVKRKYRNKNKLITPPALPLPSPSILSTRYRKQNQMLIEQNCILSNRVIEIQGQNSNWIRQELSQGLQNVKCQIPIIQRQKQQYLNNQIVHLRQQLEQSNKRLLQNEDMMYEKMRLLELETERTHHKTQRVYQLTNTVTNYEQQSRRLNIQVQQLQNKIIRIQKQKQQVKREKEQFEREKQGLIRKQILEDVMKQLNQQMKGNQLLRSEYQQMKNKLIAKENEFRGRQIEYAEKIDQYSIINQKHYQELKKAHNNKIQDIQLQAANTITILRKQIFLSQEASKFKEQETLRLAKELENTKDQLKQTKRVKKQSIAKKHIAQKESLLETHIAEIKSLNQQIVKYKSQYRILKQAYDNKIKLMDIKFKMMKERFQIEVISKLQKAKQKSKLQAITTAETLIQSFSNYVHKESIITKLNKQLNQLKSKKEKNPKQILATQEDIKTLNSQMLEQRSKVQKSICDEKIFISEQKILKVQAHSLAQDTKIQSLEAKLEAANSQVKQMEKKLKQKLKIQNKESNSCQQELRQEIQVWKNRFSEIRKQRDDIQIEAKSKKDVLNHLKATTRDNQNQISQQKKQNQDLRQQIQKLKKIIKEYQRKQQVFKDNKDKLDNIRSLQKQNNQLKYQLQDKSRSFKLEIAKKESLIKLLKQKEIAESIKQDSRVEIENTEILSLEEQQKKLRAELDRKDGLIKIYKDKIEKLQEQIQRDQKNNQERSHRQKTQLIRETKKYEQLKLDNKKAESQIFSLKGALRRVHDSFSQLESIDMPKKKQDKQLPNLEIFSQGLSILNITPKDIQHFLPQKDQQCNTSLYNPLQQIIKKVGELMPMIKQRIYQ